MTDLFDTVTRKKQTGRKQENRKNKKQDSIVPQYYGASTSKRTSKEQEKERTTRKLAGAFCIRSIGNQTCICSPSLFLHILMNTYSCKTGKGDIPTTHPMPIPAMLANTCLSHLLFFFLFLPFTFQCKIYQLSVSVRLCCSFLHHCPISCAHKVTLFCLRYTS